MSKLLETVGLMTKSVNPRLRVTGVILCMHDPASTHTKEVVADMAEFFEQTRKSGQDVPWKSARVLSPPIRRNIKLAECPSFGKSIFDYAPVLPGRAGLQGAGGARGGGMGCACFRDAARRL